MTFRELKAFLTASKRVPPEPENRTRWLEGRDVSRLLEDSMAGDVPIYVSGDSLYLYAAFVPEERLTGDWIKDGLAWNFSVPRGWGYGYRSDGEKQESPAIFPPLDHTGSRILDGAEPLIFWRCLEGRGRPYLELNQRFAHISGIHKHEEGSAYRRLDRNGDFEDVVITERSDSGWICTASRSALDFYMFLTGTVLLRVFDVIRPFPTWGRENRRDESIVKDPQGSAFTRRILAFDKTGELIGGLLRGFQVVRRQLDDDKLWKAVRGEPLEPTEFATFLIHDWKNGRIVEWPASPARLGNYFVESDLPFQTSPAFFRPEVLSKYKQDPDKYELDVRSIRCRGAWSLQSYDINEEGQVHAYIGDLGDLPYAEQLHWKQFNEPPLWSTRGTDTDKALEAIGHVVTESAKEWKDAILDLARIVVEGFEASSLRRVADSLGCDDRKLRSLKLIRRILEARGVNNSIVGEVCDPLDDLQTQRSEKAVHGLAGKPPARPREDFRSRLLAVKTSLQRLSDLIRNGVFDLGIKQDTGV